MKDRKERDDYKDERRKCWGCVHLYSEHWPNRSIDYICKKSNQMVGCLAVFGTLVEPREAKEGCHEPIGEMK